MNVNIEIDPELARRLGVLREQPARDPAKAAQGRAAFLEEAQEFLNSLPLTVTACEQRRHIRWKYPLAWIKPLQSIFQAQRKERSTMFGALGTILLIVSLILGGSGATVAAAQNSLPDQALYPVKTWSEDVRTGMTSSTQTRLELALEYTSRRAEELQVMLRAGQTPPEAVQARMQAEIDLSIQLAAGQPDRQAVQAFEQIRQQLQVHEQVFLNLGKPTDPKAEALLDRTRTMLQDRLHLCEVGLKDPAMLRQQLRDRDQKQDGGKTPSAPALMPSTAGKANPWTTGTPTPGSSYGPGPGDGAGTTVGDGGDNPWTTGTPTPGSGYGPGPGDGAGGNNPWTTGTPTPGSGYGPGPGDGSGSGSGGGADGGTGGAGSPGGGGSGAGGSSNGGGAGSGDGGMGGSGAGGGSDSGGTGTGGTGGSGGRP